MSNDLPNDRARQDQHAFEQLFKTEYSRLVDSLSGLVKDRARAEDLAATAFERAWEKRAEFRGEASLETWLHAIAYNAARESLRRDWPDYREPMETLEIARYAEPDRISKNLERVELHRSIEGALAQVPPKLRRVLRDHYVSDRSVQQIAKREGIAVGTVLSRLFNARGLLRQAWEQDAISLNQAHEDKVSRTVDEGLGRLASDLKAGRSETLKEFLAAMGRFHRYSWTNTLLIQQQYPSATRVAGYHTWNDLGRHVKRGEKGIMICAPLLTKVKDQPPLTRGKSPRDVESVRVTGFRAAYVFDIEQTDGRPLPAFAETRGDPETFMDKLKGFVAEQGIRFSYDPSIAPADGLSSGGEIRLRPGLSRAEEFSVLTHELAHEMLHRGADRLSLSKVVRETQAEAVAFVVNRGIGLETGTAARDYIALYNGDDKTLTESLTAIQQVSSRILNALLPREPEQPERSGDRETVANNDSERADREGVTPARPASGPEPTDGLSLER